MRWSWCHITAIFRIKPFLVHPCSLDTPSAYFLHGRPCKKEINPGSMFILLVFVPLCFMVIRFVIIPSWYRLAFTYIKAVGVSDGDLWNLFRSSHTYIKTSISFSWNDHKLSSHFWVNTTLPSSEFQISMNEPPHFIPSESRSNLIPWHLIFFLFFSI